MFPLPLSHLPQPPAPTRLIRAIDPRVPLTLKRQLIEPLLNRTFAEPLAEGEFDALEGRRISLHVEDLGVQRRLVIEGDTELGADGKEPAGRPRRRAGPGPAREWLARFERMTRQER